ncbi:hypothetical protein [Marinicrinis sediminis]|uniref:Uncharacterized protein n=1 Tax=Marinicrinis sediminis TaxID=1652465 RepID=A0ABW5RDA7_9BACL
MLEEYPLSSVIVHFQGNEEWLTFEKADLKVNTEWNVSSWFVDLVHIQNEDLLAQIRRHSSNEVEIQMETRNGHTLRGSGYFYPSTQHNHGSIRGEDQLAGLNQILPS